jgi:hypothetical protein
MPQCSILFDDLSSAFKKKRKEKGKTVRDPFFPGQKLTSGSATPRFFWLLGAIESCFKGQSLNFMCT